MSTYQQLLTSSSAFLECTIKNCNAELKRFMSAAKRAAKQGKDWKTTVSPDEKTQCQLTHCKAALVDLLEKMKRSDQEILKTSAKFLKSKDPQVVQIYTSLQEKSKRRLAILSKMDPQKLTLDGIGQLFM